MADERGARHEKFGVRCSELLTGITAFPPPSCLRATTVVAIGGLEPVLKIDVL